MARSGRSSDVGTCFGKYFLDEELAAGGMGEVFIAKQQGPAGIPEACGQEDPGSPDREQGIHGGISRRGAARRPDDHRNIVQVFGARQQDGAIFIAMEYVQGVPARRDRRDHAPEGEGSPSCAG